MAWQDRSYYRDSSSGQRNPLWWLLTGSIPLFTVFQIHVRMHVSLILLGVGCLIDAMLPHGIGWVNAGMIYGTLFTVVLLHEFGHCFAARSVGGDANQILLWPLGGLAYADAPHRPWPQFVRTVGGPLVNVAICVVMAIALTVLSRGHPELQLNPLSKAYFPPPTVTAYVLWYVFAVSWGLLLFNLWPVYPLDGGRMLQELLWFKLGYYRASMVASVVGMFGAGLMTLIGVRGLGSWYGLVMIFLGVSCFITCYQLRAMLKAEGPWAFEDENNDYSAAMWQPEPMTPAKRKKLSRRAVRKLRRLAQSEESEQKRIDDILAKVSAHGMTSLTWTERRELRKATERQRDMEVPTDAEPRL